MGKDKLKNYDIPFVGLKQGEHLFEYDIDESFFELFDYHEFEKINQKVEVKLLKKSNLLELFFTNKGDVRVNCDLTDEPFDLFVEGDFFLIVKFGQEYNDENDELLIIPNSEHTINVAQYIYEMIVLSVPVKRIHPKVLSGEMGSDILDMLDNLSPKEIEEEPTQEIDPRWNDLKKLLN